MEQSTILGNALGIENKVAFACESFMSQIAVNVSPKVFRSDSGFSFSLSYSFGNLSNSPRNISVVSEGKKSQSLKTCPSIGSIPHLRIPLTAIDC